MKQRDLPGVRENSARLDAMVAEHSPAHREAGWRENCEVILVAIVVAVGVRSYFIQPFKIPTGSMQPTLNGIIGHSSTAPGPNILQQVAEFFVLGRNYINVVAPEDETVREVVEQKYLFFFTWSRIITDRGMHRVYAPEAILVLDFHVATGAGLQCGKIISSGAIDTDDEGIVE